MAGRASAGGPVLLIWERFGPYHIARAHAAAARMPLACLEIVGRDATYAWESAGAADLTLHRLAEAEAVLPPRKRLRRELHALLDRIAPRAVAIPGWSAGWAMMALEWCRERGVAPVLMSDSNRFDAPRRALGEALKRRIVAQFPAALAAGTSAAAYLTGLGMAPGAISLGYDVVDNAHFAAPAGIARGEADAAAGGGPAFLAAGRFVEKKDLPGLLRGYALYRERAGSGAWRLVILGDGPLRREIEGERDRLGLGEAVHLAGFRQYGELPDWYAAADCFVHVSRAEQWGLVINEAMAAGLPVIASSACGAAADLVVEGGNGLTVPPGDPQALAGAMAAIVAHPDRAGLGRRSREIVADWGLERFADGLASAVGTALSAAPASLSVVDRAILRALGAR